MHRIKYQLLLKNLKKITGLVVAFSGGVDSTLLLRASVEALGGDRVLAASFHAPIHGSRELSEIKELLKSFNCRSTIIEDNGLLEQDDFIANSSDRCYICKRILFGKLLDLARRENIPAVADGSNSDDLGDFRPGMRATRELNVISPLQEAGLTKHEIRLLSRELQLSTWNKPSSPCLCSRIPYGSEITEKKLRQVEYAENFLHDLGFGEVRLRHHENLARIEVPEDRIKDILKEDVLPRVKEFFREIGFQYVTVDLHGFRSGSLNEVL